MKYLYYKDTKVTDIKEEFNQEMHKIIYSYYYGAMNGNNVGLGELKRKWGTFWYKNKTKEDIMFSNSNTLRSELGVKGVFVIDKLWEVLSEVKHAPLAVEQEYCVQVGEHYVTGTIELIREIKLSKRKSSIDIVNYCLLDANPDKFVLNYDLSVTAQAYAFRNIFKRKEDSFTLYYLRKDKTYQVTRTQQHFDNFADIVNMVATSIEAELFYPKYSIECKGCNYQRNCHIRSAD